ncbi:MAG: MFS transporter [Clostridia bacterium]|nr:MFS transporter [Clostridia bacterium]
MSKSKKQTLTFGKALMYGLGIFGVQFFIGYVNSYQSQFYTSIFGADLMICAVIILVSKVISSFADPIIGNIIDNSHFKSGKMLPFVRISALPLALMTTLLFVKIPFANSFLMYAYITVTTVLWNICMSFADIPSQGMLALLSSDSGEKSMAAGISNTMRTIALGAPGVVVPLACILTGSAEITEKEYLIAAVIIDVVGLLLYLGITRGSKEVVQSPPQKMSFKDMFDELKNNRMLLIVFLIYMLGFGRNMAMGIGVQTAAVLFDVVKFDIGSLHIELAGENLSIVLGMASAVAAMISIVVAPIINSKLGEKKTYLAFGVYGTVTSVVCYLLFVFGGEAFRSFTAIMLYQFIIGFMFGTHGYSPMVMLSDTVDYQEMITGRRTEGIQYSVLSLGIKLSNAISVAGGIFIVGLSGYQGTMTYADVTPSMQNTVTLAYWLIPGICVALSCIPVLFYKIDANVKAQIDDYKKNKVDVL